MLLLDRSCGRTLWTRAGVGTGLRGKKIKCWTHPNRQQQQSFQMCRTLLGVVITQRVRHRAGRKSHSDPVTHSISLKLVIDFSPTRVCLPVFHGTEWNRLRETHTCTLLLHI
ncbi:hypothetical protein PHYPO_G00072350 [Pangasianodon hypophthalmus]|uniref:Uncharacterized protein n=1 Tax=Pangasianodon hypophthalmus TaxID=310915 RepID=A0A5N5LUB9_PANHP|nr:hypothetical protein PHYPO_G00072350 [Pangasianodon hypophthalmus]